MRDVKLYLSALVLAGLAGLPLAAQQPSQNPSPSTPQSTPSQTTPSEPSPATQQPAPAPQTEPGAQTPQQGDQTASPTPSTANSPEASNNELRPIQGELEKKLDAKSAKAGDAVVVKTTEKATFADGVVIPKGSKIVGQVVDAQPAGGNNKNSKVTVLFNQAQLKDGQNLPIKSVLQSLAPASGSDNSASSFGATAPVAPSAPSGGAMAGSGASPMGGSPSAQPQSSPSAAAGPAPTMGAGNNASAGNSAPVAGTVVAKQGNVAIRTTQIPGVLIASSVNGQPFSNASGAILGAQQNVHLDGGTHVVLAIADAGTKASNTK